MANTATTAAGTLTVDRISPAIGARVSGIDISGDLEDVVIAEIRAALVEHKVLVFNGQELNEETHVKFGRRFGELTFAHPVMAPLDDFHPEIWQIDSKGGGQNDNWHTDVTFVERPPLGSILRPIRIPDVGGDTNWASLEAAYDSLAKPLQDLADGLTAFHDGSHEFEAYLSHREGK